MCMLNALFHPQPQDRLWENDETVLGTERVALPTSQLHHSTVSVR